VKIYRIDHYSKDEGSVVAWASSKREAEKRLRSFIEAYGAAQGPSEVTVVNIPTTRQALIDWLNRHLNAENG